MASIMRDQATHIQELKRNLEWMQEAQEDPAINASYSTWLLKMGKSNFIESLTMILPSFFQYYFTQIPLALEAPSTNNVHLEAWDFLSYTISTKKSTKSWAFTAILSLYRISNFESSTDHAIIFPIKSGSICRIGWSILTTIRCAWKYWQRCWAVTTKAKATSSNFWYRSSGLCNALLMK